MLIYKRWVINNRFAWKFISTNIFSGSQDGWDWKRPLKVVWLKLRRSWLSRTVFKWLLNVSKDRDYATCPGNLCQCVILFTEKKWKSFLMFKGNLLCFSLCPLPCFYIKQITFEGILCISDRSCQKKSRRTLTILDDLCSAERLPEKKATDLYCHHDKLHPV